MSFSLPPVSVLPSAKIKRTVIVIVILLLLVMGGLFAFRMFMMMKMGGGPMGGGGFAVAVNALPPRAEKAMRSLSAVGTLRAVNAVDVAAEVSGRVAELSAAEGKAVKKGDVLARLDTSVARAEFEEAKAALELALANFGRASNLANRKFGTERARDEAESTLQQVRARLALATARLEKMDVKAPFDGVLGLRQVSVGAYVGPGMPLFSLSSTDPMLLDFRAPELKAPHLAAGQEVDVEVEALPGRLFKGRIEALDAQLDEAGRSLGVRVHVPNADGALRAGMFARLTVRYGTPQDVLVVPERAIFLKGTEAFVYRAEGDVAKAVKVTLGERRVGEVEIATGLASTDEVVSDGQIKLHEGSKVLVLNRPNLPPGAPAAEKKQDNTAPAAASPASSAPPTAEQGDKKDGEKIFVPAEGAEKK